MIKMTPAVCGLTVFSMALLGRRGFHDTELRSLKVGGESVTNVLDGILVLVLVLGLLFVFVAGVIYTLEDCAMYLFVLVVLYQIPSKKRNPPSLEVVEIGRAHV